MKTASIIRPAFLALAVALTGCKPADPPSRGSDFAILTQTAENYTQAQPGQGLAFPADHGPHNDYRIEWWYLTANLTGPNGQAYGAQWTLFRLALQSRDDNEPKNKPQNRQVFMAHFAITTPQEHVSFQRYSRDDGNKGLYRAGVSAQPFSAWLDDWELKSTGTHWLPLQVSAQQDDNALQLSLDSPAPLILQGDSGFSQKHQNGGGSFYYSQPFLQAIGQLTVNGQTIPVSGQAWLDREWGSQFLQEGQIGWDWFSLHLDSGEKLMLFQLREKQETEGHKNYLHGSLMSADGSKKILNPDQLRLEVLKETVVEGRKLPLHWRISVPQIDRQFEVEALHKNQWMNVDFPYWEGVVTVKGNTAGSQGEGYMELTGYPTLKD